RWRNRRPIRSLPCHYGRVGPEAPDRREPHHASVTGRSGAVQRGERTGTWPRHGPRHFLSLTTQRPAGHTRSSVDRSTTTLNRERQQRISMPPSRDMIGRTLSTGSAVVDAAHVAAFARALRDANPAYQGPEATTAPLTYPIAFMAQAMAGGSSTFLELDL